MKKIIALLLFVLPFMSLKTTAQNIDGAPTGNAGIIESIDAGGNGTLTDGQTGELKSFFTRDGEFHLSPATIIIGSSVIFVEVKTPSGREINVVIKVNGNNI